MCKIEVAENDNACAKVKMKYIPFDKLNHLQELPPRVHSWQRVNEDDLW